jgi:protein required for attachment to host cells
MKTTWIVAADASRARILQVTGRDRLSEIDDLVNPKGRLDDRELTTDAHPRFRGTQGPARDREQTGAAEHEAELFSKRIGSYLDKARVEHRYERLLVLAPPRFLGLMRKNMGKEVEKLVVEEIDKNLSWFDARDIDRFLKERNS